MHLVLGTAGHIDHGKSSLVKALTGSDPDRLPEEKARGVTIELGFAHLSLDEHEIGIVDVPGHADFVNNMVAGVGALNLALFIIAADDGWMPQSEEHLHILTYMGITHIVIALTKTDICEDVPFSIEMLRDELRDTPLKKAPIIPVSSITGEGIEELKKALLKEISTCPEIQDQGKPRLSIDRIFSPKGAGTVVTGTLTGGAIKQGDTLILQPLGNLAKVRYIQNHSQALDTALPGMRTALNLPDLPINAPGKPGAQRGNTLCMPNTGTPTDTLDIEIQRLARPIPGIKPRALRHMETCILHHGSSRCQARVILHGRTHLQPGEKCLAQLRLDTPLYFLTGDRLVLRDGSQTSTLAGGVVLDTHPTRQGFRTDARSQFLLPRAEHPDDLHVYLKTLLTRDHQLPSSFPNTPWSDTSIRAAIESLISEKSITQLNDLLLDTAWWETQIASAQKTIQDWHTAHPDLPAIPIDQLPISQNLLPHLIQQLETKGYKTSTQGISAPNHNLSLPAEISTQAQSILDTLNQSGLQPPNRSSLTPDPKHEQAMLFLIRSGQVIELDPKIVISASTLAAATEKVRRHLTAHGQATASELKQCLDTTRKIAMPLLEHLDSLGVTQREENYRKLL